jgi:hypothetical protein
MARAKLILSDPTRDEMLAVLAQSGADEFDIEAAIYWFAGRLAQRPMVEPLLGAFDIALPARMVRGVAAHPELYEVALARAWEMGISGQSVRINRTLFDDNRHKSKESQQWTTQPKA